MMCDTDNTGGNHVSVNIEMQDLTQNDEKTFEELCTLISTANTKAETRESFEHFNKIRDILNENPNIICASIRGRNIFHAIANQPAKGIEILKLVGFNNDDLHIENISNKKLETLLYMTHGAKKRSPIHVAVEVGFTEFVKIMLNVFPSLLSVQDRDGNTSLHLASSSSMPSAVECLECLLDYMERNNLAEEILMKTRNCKGQTPIHCLCYKVPKNRDANIGAKLKILLKFGCTREILEDVDLSKKTPLHLLCCKEDQFVDCSKNYNVRILLRDLIQQRKGINYPTQDEQQRSALQLLAISELPALIEILIQHPECDVTLKDGQGKMAIHYSAERCIRPKSQECFKILSSWTLFQQKTVKAGTESQDMFRNYLLWDSFEEGGKTNTALTLACNQRSTQTVEYILKNVFEAKNTFGIWFLGKDKTEIYSLQEVYKDTPAALEFLFDKSVKINMDESNERRIEFTTDLSVITALDKPIQESKTISEMEYLAYAKSWPEEIRGKLLLHPLTRCTLHAVWQKMLPYKIAWILINLIWLSAYFIFVPYKYHMDERHDDIPTRKIVAGWTLCILSILYTLNELLAIQTCSRKNWTFEKLNWRGWLHVALTLFAIYEPCLESLGVTTVGLPRVLEDYCAAGGILLTFFLFTRNIGIIYLPFGIYVEYMLQTLQKIIEAFLCCTPLIIGFERAFRQMFPENFTATSIWTFTKTLVMMTGEFEYNEMYQDYKDGEDETATNSTTSWLSSSNQFAMLRTLKLLIFLVFLILLPITFYNLVTGIVVDKIKNMESRLEMYQIYNQIRLINYVQLTMVAKMKYFFSCFSFLPFCYVSYRSDKDGDITFDQELKWYVETDLKPPRWSFFGHRLLPTNKSCDSSKNGILCGNVLPGSVRKRIIDMYKERLNAEGRESTLHNLDANYIT